MSNVRTLYRFYDAEDVLLYVGLSVNPGRRMEKHKATQPWWSDVARIEMEQHEDLKTLQAAEREAIKTEQPLHNVRMNGRATSARPVEWICEVCKTPIDDGRGYVTVSYSELLSYPDRVKEWEDEYVDVSPISGWKSYTLDVLQFHPEGPRWRVLHRHCDPAINSNDYWIAVERIRTHTDVIAWSAHLFGKKWIQSTNWNSLIRRTITHAERHP